MMAKKKKRGTGNQDEKRELITSGVQSGIPGALGVRERDDEDDELAHIKYRPGDDAQIPPNDETTIQFPEYENDLFVQLIPSDENTRPIPGGENDNKLAHIKYSLGGGSSMNNGSSGYAESVFDRVTDRYRPGGKAQILPRDEVESLIPKGEEADPTQIQSGVRPGLVGASAIDPADRPPVTDDTDRILAQLIGGPDPYGAKPVIGNSGKNGYAESVFDRVTDRYRLGGKAQILPRDEVESLIPKGEEAEPTQIQSGVRPGLVGASAIDPADRPPVTDDTDRILAQLIGGPDPYGAKPSIGVVSPGGTAQNGGSSLNSGNSGGGSFENDTDASGEDEDPELQRVYEDVMGVYAAMTGGRPSTAAISAATAAAADARRSISDDYDSYALRELLNTIPDDVTDRVTKLKNNADLESYLDQAVEDGTLSSDEADVLYETYMTQYEVVDDGGKNFFGGIDRNAIIKDENGNRYRLIDLVDELVKTGMTKKEARAYVLSLQEELGIGD